MNLINVTLVAAMMGGSFLTGTYVGREQLRAEVMAKADQILTQWANEGASE